MLSGDKSNNTIMEDSHAQKERKWLPKIIPVKNYKRFKTYNGILFINKTD